MLLLHMSNTRTFVYFFILTMLLIKNSIQAPGSGKVYKATDYFYTQFCPLRLKNTLSGTITVTADHPQTNIIKNSLSMAQFMKPANQYFKFTATVIPSAGSTSSFDIFYQTESAQYRSISVFLIVIKQQPTTTPFVDLIPVCNIFMFYFLEFLAGSQLDTDTVAGNEKQSATTYSIASETIFPATDNLEIMAMTSSLIFTKVIPAHIQSLYSFTYNVQNSNQLQAVVKISGKTKMTQFRGFLLCFDKNKINSAQINGQQMEMFSLQFKLTKSDNMNFTQHAPDFGPVFQGKCFYGIKKMVYEDSSQFYFAPDTSNGVNGGTFETLRDKRGTDQNYNVEGGFFCIGWGQECSQLNPYYEGLFGTCHASAVCTQFTGPGGTVDPTQDNSATTTTNIGICISCVQSICTSCLQSDRSACSQCDSSSDLQANNKCECKTNYISILRDIKLLTNGTIYPEVVDRCQFDCSTVLPGCQQTKCESVTFCNRCQDGYFQIPDPSGDQTKQQCGQCLTSCMECNQPDTCVKCVDGFGINKQKVSGGRTLTTCETCSVMLEDANCKLCQSWDQGCTQCIKGYGVLLQQKTNKKKCVQCSSNIAKCLKCQGKQKDSNPSEEQLYCTKCNAAQGYILNPKDNGLTCVTCDTLISNCAFCEDQHTCTECKLPYLLGAKKQQLSGTRSAYNTTLCTKCIQGMIYRSGFCMEKPGCANSIMLSSTTADGSAVVESVCLGCIPELNYFFNPKTKKCECTLGYAEKISPTQTRCVQVCGDSLVKGVEQCDDGNVNSQDGCGKDCMLQEGFECVNKNDSKSEDAGTIQGKSICTLHFDIKEIQLKYILRVLGQNKGIFAFYIGPQSHNFLTMVDWSRIITFNFSQSTTSKIGPYTYNKITQQLLVEITYLKELQNLQSQTKFRFSQQEQQQSTKSTLSSSTSSSPGGQSTSKSSQSTQPQIQSNPSQHILKYKINGRNAPLVFEDQTILGSYEVFDVFGIILSVLIFIQFIIGSYMSKLIGLQTIHVLQTVYFVRILVKPKTSSLMNSLNSLQYSNGFNNFIAISNPNANLKTSQTYNTVNNNFLKINLKRQFFNNVNILIPVIFLIISIYIWLTIKKTIYRNRCISSRKASDQDKYTIMKRRCTWIYDHLVFPLCMMQSYIVMFSTILSLQSSQRYPYYVEYTTFLSFSFNFLMLCINIAIYCLQIFTAFQAASTTTTNNTTSFKKQTFLQKLDHDENNPDAPNYHKYYIGIYLIFYLINTLIISSVGYSQKNGNILTLMISTYALQITLIVWLAYWVLIFVWKPYTMMVRWHNYSLLFYYAVVIVFLCFCEMFQLGINVGSSIFLSLMYCIMLGLLLVLVIGYARLFVQKKYRKQLQKNGNKQIVAGVGVGVQNNNNNNIATVTIEQQKTKSILALQNPFLFENQLKQMKKEIIKKMKIDNYDNQLDVDYSQSPIDCKSVNTLTKEQQKFLIQLIRKSQNIVLKSINEGKKYE